MSIRADIWWAPRAFTELMNAFYNVYLQSKQFEEKATAGNAKLSDVQNIFRIYSDLPDAVQTILGRSDAVADITRYARLIDGEGSTYDMAAEYNALVSAIDAAKAAITSEFGSEQVSVDADFEPVLPLIDAARFSVVGPLVVAVRDQAGTSA